MKKLISLLLAVLLVISGSSIALADGSEREYRGESADIYEQHEPNDQIIDGTTIEAQDGDLMITDIVIESDEDLEKPAGIQPMATVVTPTVTVNSISMQALNSTVTVKATATKPCFRMAAKWVYGNTTTWLGEVNSNSYSKSFKVTSVGRYTVTVYARSYPESDSR